MSRHTILLAIPLIFMVIGCSATWPVSTSSTLNVGGAIDVEMWASSGCVQPGDKVHLRAIVTNKTSKAYSVKLGSKPILDIYVDFTHQTHRGMFRWADGKPLTSQLTSLELAPGASKTIEMDWVPDQYAVVGVAAEFLYDDRGGYLDPSVLINVGNCPGFLGP